MAILLIFVSILYTYTYAAPEKGIGLAWRDCNDASKLNVGWMYTWQPFHPCPDKANFNIPWIPMIFDSSQLSYLDSLNGNYEAILGFNEPDASNQGDMTVQEALNAWPQMQAYANRRGIRLGSPATTEQEAFGWMQEFMEGVWARNYRVDFLCFHFYFNQYLPDFDEHNDLRVFLNKIKAHFPGYKIWITEIGYRHDGTAQQNYDAMEAVYDMIRTEFSDIVERWAWFTNRWRDERGVYLSLGWDLVYWSGELKPLGELYQSLPIYAPSAFEEDEVDNTSTAWSTWLAISLLGTICLCCLIVYGLHRRRKSRNLAKTETNELEKEVELEQKEAGYDMSPINNENNGETSIGADSVEQECEIEVEMDRNQDIDGDDNNVTVTQD